MKHWRNNTSRTRSERKKNGIQSGLLTGAALVLLATQCSGPASPSDGPIVIGPTLGVEITTVSGANVTGSELVATAPLGGAAQMVHGDFLTTNAGMITSERLVALHGARVSLRPGTGVDDLANAFSGLMIFVAPENDSTARVYLASAVAPASGGSIELAPIASRLDYENAQPVLTSQRFIVGVSGPTPLRIDREVEFGLQIEMNLAIFETAGSEGGGGHGPQRH